MKPRLATSKTVSKRSFRFVPDSKIEELKQVQLKKKTEAKVNWAVTAYNEWRDERLRTFKYDPGIYFADLRNLESLEKENLQHALCHFIPEVTKVRGEDPYPGSTLYQMIVSIQKYLSVNKIHWQLIEGKEFEDLKVVLDNVMKERAALNIGITKKQASVITYEMENHLWQEGFLGEQNPDQLRNTVLFLIGINVYLRAVNEHYGLRRDMPDKRSQISFEYNSLGDKCMVYREDCVSKTHNGGLADMRNERKIVWVCPSENPDRCPVRLMQKYLALCPQYTKKPNFYLQSRVKFTPSVWFAGQVVGENSIAKVVKELMKEAKIEGFFTNHSLRRSGGTRLFNAGIDRKLVKEATGHRSDAVDAYQVTSDHQRCEMSKVIANPPLLRSPSDTSDESKSVLSDISTTSNSSGNCKISVCQCEKGGGNVGEIIHSH